MIYKIRITQQICECNEFEFNKRIEYAKRKYYSEINFNEGNRISEIQRTVLN